MVVYADDLLEARTVTERPEWVHIEWLKPGERPMQLFRTFKRVEKQIKDQGFRGWFMASELDHTNMHRHIERVGGLRRVSDDRHVYFIKELN